MVLSDNTAVDTQSAAPSPESGGASFLEEIHLRDYFWVIRRRVWAVILVVLLTGAFAVWREAKKQPLYQATSQLLVGANQPSSPLLYERYMNQWTSQQELATYCEIIRSSGLARETIERLGANSLEDIGYKQQGGLSLRARIRGWINRILPTSAPAERTKETGTAPSDTDAARKSTLAETLRSGIVTQVVEGSRLINISYTCQDSKACARVANAIAEAFIDDEMRRRMDSTRKIFTYLRGEQQRFEKNVRDSERDLLKFHDRLDALVIGVDEKAKVQDALGKTIESLTSALAEMRVERVKREATYQELKRRLDAGEDLAATPIISGDPAILELRKVLMGLKQDLARAQAQFGPKYPTIEALQVTIRDTESDIADTAKMLLTKIENSYKVAIVEEEKLREELNKAKKEVQEANRSIVEYNMLLRVAQTNKDLFDVILKKATETSLGGDVQMVNIHIVNPAKPDLSRIASHRMRNVVLSLIFGLAMGVGLAFFIDYMDNSIRSPQEVESYLRTQLLGIIESMEDSSKQEGVPLPTLSHPKSLVSEHFRSLRTNLLFSPILAESRNLIVTSTIPQEGKTTIASNLAIVMAQSGRRVLLIDADMRRPSLHRIFQLSRSKGLSTVLIGENTVDEVVETTTIPGLHVITSGPIPPNQTELLDSASFRRFVQDIRDQFDIIIFDTPPMSVVDPVIVGRICGGVCLLVTRAGKTPRAHVKRVLRELGQFAVPVAGILLNHVDVSQKEYGGYYYYGYYRYGYHYDDRGDKGKKKADSHAKES